MTIVIQSGGETVSWVTDHEDVPLDKLMPALRSLLVAAGYHPESVESYFVPDMWTWRKEEDDAN